MGLGDILFNNIMPPKRQQQNPIHEKVDVVRRRDDNKEGAPPTRNSIDLSQSTEIASSTSEPSSANMVSKPYSQPQMKSYTHDEKEEEKPTLTSELAKLPAGYAVEKSDEDEIEDSLAGQLTDRDSGLTPGLATPQIRQFQKQKPIDTVRSIANGASDALDFFNPGNKDGLFNLDNWPIIGSSDREKALDARQEEYRESNPMPEGAMEWQDGQRVTSDKWKKRYEDYFKEQGGLEDYDTTGADTIRSAWAQDDADFGERLGRIASGLDQMSHENYDDGERMTSDAVKGKYMSGEEYRKLKAAGFGGRPDEDIDDGSTYNKIDEMRDYNFVPYIEDTDQAFGWGATQAADDITKAYNTFHNTRDRNAEPTFNYNGTDINLKDFNHYYNAYLNKLLQNEEPEYVDADDPTAAMSLPGISTGWHISQDDGSTKTVYSKRGGISPDDVEVLDNGNLSVRFPGVDKPVEMSFDQLQNMKYFEKASSNPKKVTYRQSIPDRLSYDEMIGDPVNMTFDEASALADSLKSGDIDINWGDWNLGKDSSNRKDWTTMLTTLDFSDVAPNMADLFFGSAPLFLPQTAWPMAIANGVSATQGLDPRLYDSNWGSWSRLADQDNMSGDKYLANIALSSTVPATERIAGGIGGSGGLLGKPVKSLLKRKNMNPLLEYPLDIIGEGVEEDVAQAWEDAQTNGLWNWFADQQVDEDGNPVFDKSGHEVRDPNTPLPNRGGNYASQLLENFLAGGALATPMTGIHAAKDAASNSGPIGDYRELKALRDWEKENGIDRYKEAKKGKSKVTFGPEDYGTYWQGRSE